MKRTYPCGAGKGMVSWEAEGSRGHGRVEAVQEAQVPRKEL